MKPIVFDLFCGLGGWSEAFITEGYDAIGFDIEAHDYSNGGYPGKLIVRDVRSLSGAELVREYGIPDCIVASPPCQEFSYMAMPWSKAKEKMRRILADPAEQKRLTDLFNQCFRIQREVCEAAGKYIPMVVENVRGAQRWVGKARWNFGSFYLWGDVPALMPIPSKARMKFPAPCGPRMWSERDYQRLNDGNANAFHHEAATLKSDGIKAGDRNKGAKNGDHKWGMDWKDGTKLSGMNWSDANQRGKNVLGIPGRNKGVSFTDAAGYKAMNIHMTYAELKDGVKGFTPDGQPLGKNVLGRMCSSKSNARKEASAMIAKIPYPLAQWIAKVFKPKAAVESAP
ncbi:MAG: DNA cytosine methyltransferase [Patescibacteria group bacterium]|nr:DNA cytosine methyltransferase [Patescibacteria group bacterium]